MAAVETWSYKSQDPSIRHMDPMAQDFYAAFGLSADETHISTVDADGVALAAIQGLYQIVKEQEAQIGELEARLAELELAGDASGSAAGPLSFSGPAVWSFFGGLLLSGLVMGGLVMVRRSRPDGEEE